jgi:hypothetical protein
MLSVAPLAFVAVDVPLGALVKRHQSRTGKPGGDFLCLAVLDGIYALADQRTLIV